MVQSIQSNSLINSFIIIILITHNTHSWILSSFIIFLSPPLQIVQLFFYLVNVNYNIIINDNNNIIIILLFVLYYFCLIQSEKCSFYKNNEDNNDFSFLLAILIKSWLKIWIYFTILRWQHILSLFFSFYSMIWSLSMHLYR